MGNYEHCLDSGNPAHVARRVAAVGVLKEVRKILNSKDNWTQHENSRVSTINSKTGSKTVKQYCLEGAIRLVTKCSAGKKMTNQFKDSLDLLESLISFNKRDKNGHHVYSVNEYNDNHTYRTVIRHLDKTIETYDVPVEKKTVARFPFPKFYG